MNRNDVWSLFKITGKIEYFLKYKEMCSKDAMELGDNESKGNNSK